MQRNVTLFRIRKGFILLLLTNVFFCISLFAQESKNRFDAGIILGLNFSELEGNGITNYLGINTGVFANAKLSEQFQMGIELLYSQNGEYLLPTYYPNIEYGQIWLNHIEIPVHVDWLVTVAKREKSHNLNFNIGVAYVRLLNYSAEDKNKVDVSNQIIYDNRDAFLLQSGMTYNFTDKIGLNLKATLPIEKGLDWTIATRLLYTFR